MQFPVRVLFVLRKFLYICNAESFCSWRTYFIESVFAHSLLENVEVFKSGGGTNNTHFLFRLWRGCNSCIPIPISIQVWGIASFIPLGSFHNLLTDKRNQLHTFCFYNRLIYHTIRSICLTKFMLYGDKTHY